MSKRKPKPIYELNPEEFGINEGLHHFNIYERHVELSFEIVVIEEDNSETPVQDEKLKKIINSDSELDVPIKVDTSFKIDDVLSVTKYENFNGDRHTVQVMLPYNHFDFYVKELINARELFKVLMEYLLLVQFDDKINLPKKNTKKISGSKPVEEPLNHQLKLWFIEFYQEKTKLVYAWSPSQSVALNSLIRNIRNQLKQSNDEVDDKDVVALFEQFIETLYHFCCIQKNKELQWFQNQFNIRNIDNHFNTLFSYVKNAMQSNERQKQSTIASVKTFLSKGDK